MLRSGQKWSLASRADRGLRCTLGKTSAPFGATHARGEGARPERSGIQSVAVGGSPSIKYDESHHTAPELEDRHRSHESARARATPRPRTRRHRGSRGFVPRSYTAYSGRPHGHGGPGQDRRAAAKMPFRSAIRLAYSLHMRCRDLPWTDTSAVRSLAHTEQRNRCGLAALSTRDSPRSSCVARRGRAPARRTADRLRTSRPRCRTYPDPRDRISGGGTRPSAVLSRPKPGARVYSVEWISGSVLVSGIRIGSIARLSTELLSGCARQWEWRRRQSLVPSPLRTRTQGGGAQAPSKQPWSLLSGLQVLGNQASPINGRC